MNAILKGILKGVEAVATATVPGGPMIDAAVHSAIDHKGDKGAIVDDALDAAEGAIKAVEGIKGVEIADEVQFRAGCGVIETGLKMVHASLKPTPVVPAPAVP